MPFTTPLFDKFMASAASSPWPTLAGARFSGLEMADLDGDGRGEAVLLIPDPTGMLPPSLGIMSYFDYTQIDPGWSSVATPIQMVATGLLSVPLGPSLIRQAPFVDRQQSALLILDNSSALTLWQWQSGEGYNLLFQSQGGVVPAATGYTNAGWTLGPGQWFVAGEVVENHVAQAVIYDGNQTLGVLGWIPSETGGAFGCLCVQTTFGDGWSLAPGTVFWIGDVNNDGKTEVLALTPNAELAILGWNGSEFAVLSVCSGQVPNEVAGGDAWQLGNAMRLSISDVDSNGRIEVVGFQRSAPGSDLGLLGVMRCHGNQLFVVGSTVSGIGAPPDAHALLWTQPPFVGAVNSTKGACIVVFTLANLDPFTPPATPTLNFVEWSDSSGFSVASLARGSLPALQDGSPGWTLGPDNLFALSDVDGDGLAEILVQSDAATAIGVLKWTGATVETLWLGAIGVGSPAPMQNWGMGLIYGAPVTAFAYPLGELGDIYAQLNAEFQITAVGGIRFEYQNAANVGKFANWQSSIQAQLPLSKSTWPWVANYSAANVEALFNAIIGELASVEALYGISGAMSTCLGNVQLQRTKDMGAVLSNLVATPPPEASVSYWPGQIAVATIWGAAAVFSDIPGAGPVLSVLASILGSALSQPSGSPGALPAPTAVQYSKLEADSADDDLTAATVIQTQLEAISQDPVKLALLGALTEGPWPILNLSEVLDAEAASNYNRLYYYQMLMPTIFQWTQWRLTSASAPWIMTAVWQFGGGYWTEKPLTVNGATPPFWANDGSLFMFQQFNSSVEAPGLPSQDLVTDLFTSLSLSPADLIRNMRGWNFTTYCYSIGDDIAQTHFYITNSASQPIWCTIYFGGSNQESGWVQPGEFYVSQNVYGWQGHYMVRGQLNGWSSKRWNTTINDLEPWQVDQGATACTGNWLTFVEGSTNVYWQLDNP